MRAKIKVTLSILALIASIFWLQGCKKSSPSIVGKWTRTSFSKVLDSNGVVILDTTYYEKLVGDTFVFYANGKCAYPGKGSSLCSYTLNGNVITIPDTFSNFLPVLIDTILVLTDNSLILSPPTSMPVMPGNNNNAIYTEHFKVGYSR